VSRAAIAAGGTAVLLFSVGLALRIPMSLRARRSLAYLFPVTALLLGIAVLVAGERFSQVSGDLAARRGHWQRLVEPSASGEWQSLSQSYDERERPPAWRLRPTEKLSLSIAAGSPGVVDVTSVRLLDAQGRDHVRNGSFASPGVYWLVSAGDQWAWNTFSLFVEVVFEQGWIALFALLVALAYVLTALGRRATDGDLVATAFAAAHAGFLIPSLFDALIDEPRMRLLLGLLVALPLLTAADRNASARAPNIVA
jgi:hypothetical protein